MDKLIQMTTDFNNMFELHGIKPDWEIVEKVFDPNMIVEEMQETIVAIDERDVPEVLDGFADITVLAIGGIYKMLRVQGQSHDEAEINVQEVLKRVFQTNLNKLHDGMVVRDSATGKIVKPADWKAPDFNDIIGE